MDAEADAQNVGYMAGVIALRGARLRGGRPPSHSRVPDNYKAHAKQWRNGWKLAVNGEPLRQSSGEFEPEIVPATRDAVDGGELP